MASLQRLLALVDYAPSRDQLWLVGDLVNRGPRSLDVLRWARDHDASITCVLGNHDLHLLARAAGVAGEKQRDTLDDVLAAPDCDRLIDWLRARPLVHAEDAHLLVHAGLHPQWTADDALARAREIEHELRGPGWRAFLGQVANHGAPPRWHERLGGGDRWRAILAYLVRARTCRADGRLEPDFDGPPAQAPAGCVPWFALPQPAWATTHTAVFGHWAALGLDIGPRHIALDTGCVWGKSLTAMRLEDRSVFQVKAVEAASS
ncbi:MAG: bis(5-nucleosyl)-tetraphosphatase(symmetrical) [Deltaproteobacteria bacterium]|nr:bis(5-nucleosyl)-tetraphosphatase(symmetrical) [Deltaproteobacteria bacterium]